MKTGEKKFDEFEELVLELDMARIIFAEEEEEEEARIVVSIKDITDRKRAEEALRESEERFRRAINATEDGLWEWDIQTNQEFFAPRWCEIIGYSFNDPELPHTFKSWASRIHPDDYDFMMGVLNNHLENAAKYDVDYRHRHKSGEYRWQNSRGQAIFDESGKPIKMVGCISDITDRKFAEEHIHRQGKLLSAINSVFFETLTADSAETVAHTCLKVAQELTGSKFGFIGEITPEGLFTTTALNDPGWDTCRIPETQANVLIKDMAIRGIWGQVLLKEQSLIVNDPVSYPDRAGIPEGHPPLTSFLGVPLKDQGKVIGMIAMANRVSGYTADHQQDMEALSIAFVEAIRRKQAEEALRESEEKYRSLFDNAVEGIFQTTPEGRFLSANPAQAKLFGYDSPQELMERITNIGRQHYVNPEDRETYRNTLERDGVIKGFETQLINKDGSSVWASISARAVRNDEGVIIYYEGTLEDITTRKQAEEEKQTLKERLQRTEKMESLGTLAGGVAHDLNNVLGIVVGYAELILMNADESSSIRPHLVNIMNGGMKAAAIVDDLLTLARRGVSGRDVLNLNKIIADFQRSPEFEKLYSYHPSVKIKTDLEPDLPNISGSSVHLAKSLYNLVSNASEAMTKGGGVTIKTANQYLDKPIHGYDQIRAGDYVVLSVSDTGEGIPAADLKRIFEPFYTKKVMGRSGTGLGLAVVWGTVKDHHGYINVESEEGKGSAFTLYFPVTREDITADAVATAISEYMGSGESILVVDDVKEQRDLAAGMLRMLHYNVSSVASGEDAVAYMKEHEVDLMVLDMIMDPGMDGLDTYKQVLEIHPKQKAIIVSGFSETERVKAAKGLGAGAYVRKPYIKEKLGLAVRKELDRK